MSAPQPTERSAVKLRDSILGPRRPARLPPHMFELLRYGDRDGRYHSRSEAVLAIITSSVTCGVDKEWLFIQMRREENLGGEHLRIDFEGRRVSERKARIRFDRAWSKAESFVEASPSYRTRMEAQERLHEIREAVDASDWPGRTGVTDLAVMHGCLSIARRCSKTTLNLSVRDVALESGVPRSTAQRSLKRLMAMGWLRLRARGRMEANEYSLSIPLSRSGTYSHTPRENRMSHIRDVYLHLVWDLPKLSKREAQVYECLTDEGRTAEDLSVELGLSKKTLEGRLRRLAAYGLAERLDGAWIVGRADPDRVAEEHGAWWARKQRQRTYKQERDRQAAFWRSQPGGENSSTCETPTSI